MDNLDAILKETIAWYAGGGFSLKTFSLINEQNKAYAILITDIPVHKRPAGIVVFARIVGDYVVIEEDTTDRPLLDKLLERGIPREKIICAYTGEKIPEGLESPALP